MPNNYDTWKTTDYAAEEWGNRFKNMDTSFTCEHCVHCDLPQRDGIEVQNIGYCKAYEHFVTFDEPIYKTQCEIFEP